MLPKKLRLVVLVTSLSLALAAVVHPTSAQSWLGDTGVGVQARGSRGALAGARVEIAYRGPGGESGGPAPRATNEQGQASFTGLAEGVWSLQVSHPDHLSFVATLSLRRGKKAEVVSSFLEASGTGRDPLRVRLFQPGDRLLGAALAVAERPAADTSTATPPATATGSSAVPSAAAPDPPATPDTSASPASPGGDAGDGSDDAAAAKDPMAESGTEIAAPPPAEAAAPTAAEPPSPVATPDATAAPRRAPAAAGAAEEAPAPSAPPAAEAPPAEPDAPLDEADQEPPGVATEPMEPMEPTVPVAPTEPAAPEATADEAIDAVGAIGDPPPPEENRRPAPPAAPTEPVATEPPPATVLPPSAAPTVEPPTAPEAPAEAAPEPAATPPADDAPAAASDPSAPAAPAPAPAVGPQPPPAPPLRGADASARSFRDRTCFECKPGEWAVGASAEVPAGDGCPAASLGDAAAGVELLAAGLAVDLAAYGGDMLAPTVLGRLSAESRRAVEDRLGDLLDPTSACRVLVLALPAGARMSGFRFEALEDGEGGDCFGDQPCPIGDSRWLAGPGIERGAGATLLWAVFENRSSSRGRLARFVGYFTPPAGWRP